MKTADLWDLILQSGLLAVFLGFVVSGIKYGKAYIDARTLEATAKIKDANIKNAVNTAEDSITTVVAELAQTTVEDLKAKSADGKLTAEDAEQIKSDAVTKVQELLSDDVTQTLHTIFGDAEKWIDSKIEAAIKASKLAIDSNTIKSAVTNIGEIANTAATAEVNNIVASITTDVPTTPVTITEAPTAAIPIIV